MKILIVSPELIRKDERYTDDKGWAFQNAFRKLGLQVETFFYRKKGPLDFIEKKKYLREMWRSYMNKALLQEVRRTTPDIVFLSRAETVTSQTLWDIRKHTNAVMVNVFTDNPLTIGRFEAIEPCHFFFVKDTYLRDSLRKVGLKNVHYLPQCTNSDIYNPPELNEKERELYKADLTFIGSMYPYRLNLVEELTEFDLALWGRGWSRVSDAKIRKAVRGGDIRGSRKAKVISASSISLNLHHPLNDIRGTNSRTFDIAACKGFQLADFKEDLGDLLALDKEIVCYRTVGELKELVRHYLVHPKEREVVAEAAYQRVMRDHTYDKRVGEILEFVKAGRGE